ncbi:hypothetical protein PVAG01_04725 [Phlyctema vagabunda]|uniref:Uncharacterized protein n=1 Tax=Phlyctema vagabunda TaxID=108571 RepID=A0ABR4PIB0_9HELO
MLTTPRAPKPEVSRQSPTIIVKYTGFDPNEASETYQMRLAENKEFFSDRPPLSRCLDAETDAVLGETLYRHLLQDVKQKLRKTAKDNSGYRSQVEIRAFWENVREQLRDDEDDDFSVQGAARKEDVKGESKKEGITERNEEAETPTRTHEYRMSKAKTRYMAVSKRGL